MLAVPIRSSYGNDRARTTSAMQSAISASGGELVTVVPTTLPYLTATQIVTAVELGTAHLASRLRWFSTAAYCGTFSRRRMAPASAAPCGGVLTMNCAGGPSQLAPPRLLETGACSRFAGQHQVLQRR